METEAAISDPALWERLGAGLALTAVGVFSAGIYLAAEDGVILMLHDAVYGRVPFGAALCGLGQNGRSLGITTGMRAFAKAGKLCFSDLSLGLQLRREPPGPAHGELAAGFLPTVRPSLCNREDLFSRQAAPALSCLQKGLRERDALLLREAATGLIGLGQGLTPSYDDVLTGVLFTLRFLGQEQTALTEAVLASLPRTNQFSAAFLRAAAFSGDFSLLRECLTHPDARSIQSLLAVGSSSGQDMLYGLVLAAEALKCRKNSHQGKLHKKELEP